MTDSLSEQTLRSIAAGAPPWLQTQRQRAWERFEQLPLPTRRDLEWQPFDLRALKLDALSVGQPDAAALTTTLSPLAPAAQDQGVVFCDLLDAVTSHPDLLREHLGQSITPETSSKFTALQLALWQHGALLYVPADVKLDDPLEIHYQLGGAHQAVFPRTLVVIETNAEATLVQKFSGGPPPGSNGSASLHAAASEVFVKDGGQLHYVSMQNFDPHVFDFTVKRAHVGRDAEIDWVLGMFGAAFQRYDIECIMEAAGGTSFMYGVGVADERQQFGQFTKQHHRTGHTVSDLLFKNVYRDHAVGNYAGIIKVEKDANETNAYQSNGNLVLSDTVCCDTRPILEIESNRLRCTHGATVGRLDEEQLFYLQSRGLSEAVARQILIEAFTEPVLARIQTESVRQAFGQLIHDKVLKA